MEFLSKVMYVIIAVLVSVCVFMLLCEKNPGLSAPLKSMVSEYAAQHATVEVEVDE
ncbi:hypothetical protein [Butyrivibrio proteoclasticus]|uniref:hypothetical protein n=1 Tax=Butyrivibrio proteoclasticus TaxID=43305 RepID=UPI0012DE950A|nr:hypothetical protein [Butyrivibrio proteoclasticus]